jgi:hypothetical protein
MADDEHPMVRAAREFPDRRSWTTDKNGNRVLVGLTRQETEEFAELNANWWKDRTRKDGRRSYSSMIEKRAQDKRRAELRAKYDAAYQAIVMADTELQEKKPTKN